MTFYEKLHHSWEEKNSLLCVGLDSDIGKLPSRFLSEKYPQFEFNSWIIGETHDLVCAYKPNLAFYEARGARGWEELQMTMDFVREQYPGIVTIADAKRADIGSTNEGYVTGIFDELGFDAITLHPYLGKEALAPFLDRSDKGCIILCRTSNPGAGELQDLMVGSVPVWEHVAKMVRDEWNTHKNCALVVGATYPEETKRVREIAPEMPFLVPGVGAQGGDVKMAVSAGVDARGMGIIVNSARGIIFADNPRAEAEKLKNQINTFRE